MEEKFGVFTLNDVFEEQINLNNETDNFNENTKTKKIDKSKEKVLTRDNADRPLKVRQ